MGGGEGAVGGEVAGGDEGAGGDDGAGGVRVGEGGVVCVAETCGYDETELFEEFIPVTGDEGPEHVCDSEGAIPGGVVGIGVARGKGCGMCSSVWVWVCWREGVGMEKGNYVSTN